MMNIKNVSIPVSLILRSTCFRRTDFLNMNMIKTKGLHLHIPVNAFKNQKMISASERTLIPRKTPEKME